MADPYTAAVELAENLVDEFLIPPKPDWAAVHAAAESLSDIAALELRCAKREGDE